jgi:hypothetical protein
VVAQTAKTIRDRVSEMTVAPTVTVIDSSRAAPASATISKPGGPIPTLGTQLAAESAQKINA